MKRMVLALIGIATMVVIVAFGVSIGGDINHASGSQLSLEDTPTPTPYDMPDPGNAFVPDGYHLVFSDEFTGTLLDTQKWNTLAPWGVQWYTDTQQEQAFVPSAVTIENGFARFTAQPANGDVRALGQPYISGGITSKATFTYGYFEARVKVPAGKGLWPAFWLTSSTRWPPEWDIFEIVNGLDYGHAHPIPGGKISWVGGAAGSDDIYQVADQYGVYHVYGFQWTPTDVYWYVDGVLTEHYAINTATDGGDPFWWSISLQVGGTWPGDPDKSTYFPAYMDVDYMRLYQK